MNSDELLNEMNNMIPTIKNHQYKKSMINPTQFKPSLEIQLPELDHEALLQKQVKQDSSTHKTSPFVPVKITPSKKDEKNMKNNNSGKDLLVLSNMKSSPKGEEKKKKINEANAMFPMGHSEYQNVSVNNVKSMPGSNI